MERRRRRRTSDTFVSQSTAKYIPVTEHLVYDSSQTLKIVAPDVGNACIDCLNDYYDIRLLPGGCKFKLLPDGQMELCKCGYCERIRPIVIGLKISGKIKMVARNSRF